MRRLEDVDFDGTLTVSEDVPQESADLPTGTDSLTSVQVDQSLEPNQIDSATLEFTVTEEELEALDANPADVAAYHEVDGEWVERETTVLSPGDNWEESRHVVETPHFSTFVLVAESPAFEASLTEEDPTLTAGEQATVEVEIENVGAGDGTADVELLVDGDAVTSESVNVDSGESETVTLTHSFDGAGSGELVVEGKTVAELSVEEESTDKEDDDEESTDETTDKSDDDTGEDSDDEGPGFGILVALGSFFLVAVLAKRLVASQLIRQES